MDIPLQHASPTDHAESGCGNGLRRHYTSALNTHGLGESWLLWHWQSTIELHSILYCAGLQIYFRLGFNDCIITFTDYESKLHNYATPTNISIGIIVECQS